MYSDGRQRSTKRLRRDAKESSIHQLLPGARGGLVPKRTPTSSVHHDLNLPAAENTDTSEANQVFNAILQTEANANGSASSLVTAKQQRVKWTLLTPSEFRLFTLDPGSFNDQISGCLTVHDLAAPPVYYGFSYAWGQEHAIHIISINKSRVSVRPNLFQALRRVRREHSQVCIWVDDLCINQKDEVEKNAQVEHMGDIYQNARSTFIWLGEGNQSSTLARECIQSLNRSDYDWSGSWWKNHDVLALIQFLNRPWFSRGWVIQEAAFSKSATIYCGEWQLPLDCLKQAMDRMQLRLNAVNRTVLSTADNQLLSWFDGSSAVRMMTVIRNVFEKSEDQTTIVRRCLSLATLVEETKFTETTDCRDSIYAVLNLACDTSTSLSRNIVTDYSKSELDVYVDFVQHCIKQSVSLDIICRPWAPSQQSSGAGDNLPTWIATRDGLPFPTSSSGQISRKHADPLVGSIERPSYNCSLNRLPKIRFCKQLGSDKFDGILAATGIVLGQINAVSSRMIGGMVYRDALEILGKIKHNPITGWTVPESIWRSLCADRSKHGRRAPFSYGSAMLDAIRFVSESSLDINSSDHQQAMHCIDVEDLLEATELVHAHDFLNRVRDTVWDRRAFRLESSQRGKRVSKSMVGLVPRKTRPGDVICILYGCSVPIVLRKPQSTTGDETWELIGEAYVHGAMSGDEIKDALSAGTLTQIEREIKIR